MLLLSSELFRVIVWAHIVHTAEVCVPYGYSKDWGREGKSPAFPMLNGITPTDHIHLAILTQFIALHILQK